MVEEICTVIAVYLLPFGIALGGAMSSKLLNMFAYKIDEFENIWPAIAYVMQGQILLYAPIVTLISLSASFFLGRPLKAIHLILLAIYVLLYIFIIVRFFNLKVRAFRDSTITILLYRWLPAFFIFIAASGEIIAIIFDV